MGQALAAFSPLIVFASAALLVDRGLVRIGFHPAKRGLAQRAAFDLGASYLLFCYLFVFAGRGLGFRLSWLHGFWQALSAAGLAYLLVLGVLKLRKGVRLSIRGYERPAVCVTVLLGLLWITPPYMEIPADAYAYLSNVTRIILADRLEVAGDVYFSIYGFMTGLRPEGILDIARFYYLGAAATLGLAYFCMASALLGSLPWAFVATLFSFLYWGTNVFSYYKYYMFGPTYACFTLLCLSAISLSRALNEKKLSWREFAFPVAALPLLFWMHNQEAFFLLIWLGIVGAYLFCARSKLYWIPVLGLLAAVLYLGFAATPTTDAETDRLRFAVQQGWMMPLFSWGKHVWSVQSLPTREVTGTLGGFGFLIIIASTLAFAASTAFRRSFLAIYLLFIAPFFAFFIPGFADLAVKQDHQSTTWRLCYLIHFWLFFAVALRWLFERRSDRRTVPIAVGILLLSLSFWKGRPVWGRGFHFFYVPPASTLAEPYDGLLEYLKASPPGLILTDGPTSYPIRTSTRHPVALNTRFHQNNITGDFAGDCRKLLARLKSEHVSLVVINRMDGLPPSRIGELSGHWPPDIRSFTKLYSPDFISAMDQLEVLGRVDRSPFLIFELRAETRCKVGS